MAKRRGKIQPPMVYKSLGGETYKHSKVLTRKGCTVREANSSVTLVNKPVFESTFINQGNQVSLSFLFFFCDIAYSI